MEFYDKTKHNITKNLYLDTMKIKINIPKK